MKISLDRDGGVRHLPEHIADALYITPEGYFFDDAYQETHGPFRLFNEAVEALDIWVTNNL